MQPTKEPRILTEKIVIPSQFLQREVSVDLYLPPVFPKEKNADLLLINDGQSMEELGLEKILHELHASNSIQSLLCVGIHAGAERKMEYGIASQPDHLGRGAKAAAYTLFVINELLPFIQKKFSLLAFSERVFVGFSLGGLIAMDIVWNHPEIFSKVGVFSGSFWWRSVDQHDKNYNDDKHRIMQQQIRNSNFKPGLKFFFQCGNKDEIKDRNQNGIIDSIDDTLDVIKELISKGYDAKKDIHYLELKDGSHDIATWTRAMPEFLKWAFKK